jgi:hypothetical protein
MILLKPCHKSPACHVAVLSSVTVTSSSPCGNTSSRYIGTQLPSSTGIKVPWVTPHPQLYMAAAASSTTHRVKTAALHPTRVQGDRHKQCNTPTTKSLTPHPNVLQSPNPAKSITLPSHTNLTSLWSCQTAAPAAAQVSKDPTTASKLLPLCMHTQP